MTHRLLDLLPDLATSATSALRCEGFIEQADTLAARHVAECSYDAAVNAGYVYLAPRSGQQVAQTIAFAGPHWFNIDLDASGAVVGIELLSPPPNFRGIALRTD